MLIEQVLKCLKQPLIIKIITNNHKMVINKEGDLYIVEIFFQEPLILKVTKDKFEEIFGKFSIVL